MNEAIVSVEFKDVHFTYPGTSIKVLSGISFKAEGGDFLGVMGPHGAGKTTFSRFLMSYMPDSGDVLINGNQLNDFTLHSVRDKIGFVSQEPFLFYGTVSDNVRYNQESTDEELDVALKLAGAWDFIQELENGLDTMVGDRGANSVAVNVLEFHWQELCSSNQVC